MSMTAISPQQVVDAIMSFSPTQRDEFIRLLAEVCPHEMPRAIIRYFPVAKREEMFGELYSKAFRRVLPVCYQHAREILSMNPSISDDEFHKDIHAKVEKFVMDTKSQAAQQEKEILESKRNRKPDPKTIRRNVVICKLNDEKPNLTYGQLGKQFNLSPSSIRDILEERSKWFSLADKQTLNQ